jgi:hypothetical protein
MAEPSGYMERIRRCIYCGKNFITEESLKDHMIKFGSHGKTGSIDL